MQTGVSDKRLERLSDEGVMSGKETQSQNTTIRRHKYKSQGEQRRENPKEINRKTQIVSFLCVCLFEPYSYTEYDSLFMIPRKVYIYTVQFRLNNLGFTSLLNPLSVGSVVLS